MASPTGISIPQARAYLGLLNLLLAIPGLDDDTERRARWLKLRLLEIVPDAEARHFDFIDARIALLLGQGLSEAA